MSELVELPVDENGLYAGKWRLEEWNGIPLMTCVRCQKDTLKGLEGIAELEATCTICQPPPPPPSPPPLIKRFTRYGNEVIENGEDNSD